MSDSSQDMMAQVQELIDKRGLDEMVYRTLHAVDLCDWSALRAQMLDDAEFDFTSHSDATDIEQLAEVQTGVDEFVATLTAVVPGLDAVQHHVTNMVHEVRGDTAQTTCYVYAEHFLNNDQGDRSITVGARYAIASRRTADRWRIASWRLTPSWYRGNPTIYKLAMDVAARAGQDR